MNVGNIDCGNIDCGNIDCGNIGCGNIAANGDAPARNALDVDVVGVADPVLETCEKPLNILDLPGSSDFADYHVRLATAPVASSSS